MILSERTKSSPRLLPHVFGASEKGWHAIEAFATRCPKEHQFRHVRKIIPKALTLSEPLSTGLLLHAARAQWFYDSCKGELWKESMELYSQTFPAKENARLAPNSLDVATATFREYVKFWSVRPKPLVLAVEHEIKPKALVKDAPPWAWRGARLDSIEKVDGKAWIGECKSTATSGQRVTDTYLLHGQILLQLCLWGEEETEQFGPLGGVLLDPIVKPSGKKPAKPCLRVRMPVEKMRYAMGWFVKDFTTWVMQTHLVTWDASPERRPSCFRAYGPCEYRDLCLRGRDGTNLFTFKDTKKGLLTWQPKKDQRTPPWE